jgi:hypothetical protein
VKPYEIFQHQKMLAQKIINEIKMWVLKKVCVYFELLHTRQMQSREPFVTEKSIIPENGRSSLPLKI